MILVLLILSGACCQHGTGSSQDLSVGWLSDFHFDPFFDTAIVSELAGATPDRWDAILAVSPAHAVMPVTGDDTNRCLLESALNALQEDTANPSFIVFTGDFLTHQFKEQYISLTGDATEAGLQQFTNRTLSYLISRIRQHFPTTAVYFCLGNNDGYEGDYQQSRNGVFLQNTAELFATGLLTDDANRALLRLDYPVYGSYRVELPGLPYRGLISLNSSMFSSRYTQGDAAGLAQLEWFETQLNEHPDSKFIVLMHIPTGVDVFATLEANKGQTEIGTVINLFNPVHLARWHGIVQRHAGRISVVLSGHIHRDSFRLPVWSDATGLPELIIQINSSVSPVYGNNPTIKVLQMDRDRLTPVDYRVHYVNLYMGRNQWQHLYTFTDAYPSLSPDLQGMKSLWDLTDPDVSWNADYADRYVSLGTPEMTSRNAGCYWQAVRYMDSEEWRRAVNAVTSILEVFALSQARLPIQCRRWIAMEMA